MAELFSRRVKVGHEVMVRMVGDEAVLLNLKTEQYLGLDAVAARIWNVLADSSSVQEGYEALLREYEVEPECLRRDLEEFLAMLSAQGLIETLTVNS